jgi:hypothetical protein
MGNKYFIVPLIPRLLMICVALPLEAYFLDGWKFLLVWLISVVGVMVFYQWAISLKYVSRWCPRLIQLPVYYGVQRRLRGKRFHPLIDYPLILWLEFEGGNSFKKGGVYQFREDLREWLTKYTIGLSNLNSPELSR